MMSQSNPCLGCQCLEDLFPSKDQTTHILLTDETLEKAFQEEPLLKDYFEKKRILFFHKPGIHARNDFNDKDPFNILKAILSLPGKK